MSGRKCFARRVCLMMESRRLSLVRVSQLSVHRECGGEGPTVQINLRTCSRSSRSGDRRVMRIEEDCPLPCVSDLQNAFILPGIFGMDRVSVFGGLRVQDD